MENPLLQLAQRFLFWPSTICNMMAQRPAIARGFQACFTIHSRWPNSGHRSSVDPTCFPWGRQPMQTHMQTDARSRRPCVPETLCTHRPCARCSCAGRFSHANRLIRQTDIHLRAMTFKLTVALGHYASQVCCVCAGCLVRATRTQRLLWSTCSGVQPNRTQLFLRLLALA